MGTPVYIAISSTDRTGDTVADDTGFTYADTFSSLTSAQADVTHGVKDISSGTGSDENYFYDVFNSYSEPPNILFDTNNWTIIDNLLVVRSAPNYEHAGEPGSGIVITNSDSYQNMYRIGLRTLFKDLEFIATAHGGSFLIEINGGVALRLIAKTSHLSGADAAIRFGDSALSKAVSCLAHNCGKSGISIAAWRNGTIYNCAAINNTEQGIKLGSSGGSGVYIRNNLSLDNAGGDYLDSGRAAYTATNNASSDATALGTSAIINLTSTDEVENAITPDPHLKAGNSLETLGVDLVNLSLLTADEAKDIDGQPFTGWPIGCDQPGSFTVPVKVTAYDAETLDPIVGADVYIKADTGGPLPEGTEIASGTTDVNGEINVTPEFSSIQPVLIQGRKGTLTPFYNEGKTIGTITGDGFTGEVYMVTDE